MRPLASPLLPPPPNFPNSALPPLHLSPATASCLLPQECARSPFAQSQHVDVCAYLCLPSSCASTPSLSSSFACPILVFFQHAHPTFSLSLFPFPLPSSLFSLLSLLFPFFLFSSFSFSNLPLNRRQRCLHSFLLLFFFLSFFFFFSPRASAFSPDFYALTVLRFVVGIGIGGMGVPFDLLAEFMPPKLRGKALISIEFFWYARTCSLPPLSPSLCVCSLSVICHKAHSPTP